MIIAKFSKDVRMMQAPMIIGLLVVCFSWALPNQIFAQGNLSPAPITPYGPDPNPPFVYANNMAKFRCNNITAPVPDSTLVTFDYQMWDDYEGNYQAKIELLIDGEYVTESYNFHLVNDLGQGAYSIQLDMNSLNATGAVIHVFLEPEPINDSVGYVYRFSRSGGTVTIESITTQLVGGTPMPAVPADPHCSTCEGIGTSPRGGGLCHHFANQGVIHIASDVVGATTTCGSGSGIGPAGGPGPGIPVDPNSRPTVPTVGAEPRCEIDDGLRLCNGCDVGDGLRLKANFLETAIVSDFANAWYGGSFGPGLFLTQVDSTGYLQVQDQNGNFFRVFDAGLRHATTLQDMDLDGIFHDEHGLYREAKLVDANGDPVTVIDDATRMRITRHDGSTLCFSFSDGPYELDEVPNIDLDAQIAEMIDRNGNETKILRGEGTVTVEDRYGYQLVLTYSENEVTARSVVTTMTLPNGQDVTFQYANDFLSQANYPEGLTWTFAISTNSTSQTVDITVDSPTAIPMVYKISQDFMEYNAQIISQPANVLRGVFDTFANNYMSIFTDYNGPNPDAVRVFHGSDRLFGMELGRFISVAKVFTLPNSAGFEIEEEFDSFDPVTWEDHFAENLFTTITYGGGNQHTDDDTDRTCGAPSETRTENGDVLKNLYDADNYVVYREFPDGTYESWEYNINKQVTRYRDRLANVTKYEYADEAGGWTLLKRKVGIKDLSADYFAQQNDQIQAGEYAEYTWEYNAANDVITAYSPLHNGEDDIHRTDYEYYTNGKLWKVIGAADVEEGTRPVTVYEYYPNGQVQRITSPLADDPDDKVVLYDYDLAGRLRTTTYADASTEKIIYGGIGSGLAGYIVDTKDRMGVLTTRTYDLEERLKKIEVGTGTMDENGTVTANNDATQKSVASYVYIPQTNTVIAVTTDDKRTDYVLDHRNRRIETIRYPNASTTLVTKTQYDAFNRVFYTEDPYGRREYMGYSASNGPELIRRVQFTMGDGTSTITTGNSGVINLNRTSEVNALYLITDAIKDAGGNVIELYDGRNTTSDNPDPNQYVPSVRYTYDSRNRRTFTEHAINTSVYTKSQTIYDLDNNVTEIRSPRYFDATDPEDDQMITRFTYSGRNLQLTQEVAVNGDATENGTSHTDYYLDGRVKSTTNYDSQTSYIDFKDSCCGQFVGHKDPLGHGTMAASNSVGSTTHTAVVQDYDAPAHTVQNPADSLTFGETTNSFDLLRRSTARTQWLVPIAGSVNPNEPPIAGLAGESATNGLTSQTYYDSNLADDQGFDNATGLTIQQLGGGTYNLSLSAVLAQLNTSTGISFQPTSAGSAVVSINAEEEIVGSISDGLGRSVMSFQLEPHNGTNALGLVAFRCTKYDDIHIELSSFTLVETTSYNALGPISKTRTDAAGRNLQTIEFVDNGNPSTEESNWTYYDETGNVVGFRDANGVGYDATYDELGRITSRIDTYGDQVTWGSGSTPGYDAEGNVLLQVDAKLKQTTHTYDARNRRVKTVDRLNGETITTYTVMGQIETLMDADAESAGNNEVTRYDYNERGEKTSEEFPGHDNQSNPGQETFNKVAFQYDPAGRLSLKTDQLGDTVTYKYDLAGRLEHREYRTAANSPSGTTADIDTFTFDNVGRMLTAVSGRYINTITMAYDDAGRLESEVLDINSNQYTTTRKYNNLGQLEKLFYPDGNTVVERQYDRRGQLEKVLVDYDGENNGAAAIEEMVNTFDPGGRRSTATFASSPNIVTTYEYRGGVAATPTGNIIAGLDGVPVGDTTPRDNLVEDIITNGTIGNHAGTYTYTYDANKNKVREQISGTGVTEIPVQDVYGFNTGTNNDQGYDDEDRLILWNRDDGNLDKVWNLSLVRDFNSVTTNTNQVTWTHNPAHETTAVDSVATTYDVKGNLTTNIDGDTYSWDFDNKMSSAVTDTNPDVTFKYDALGRRVAKNNTVYALAGQQVVAEYASSAPVTAPSETYVYASYIDEPILKKRTQDKLYYINNQQKSVMALVDSTTGSVVERYAYTAYGDLTVMDGGGNVLNSGTAYANPYTYTGRRYDPETELYYFRARYYDSKRLSRFISKDPIGYWDGMNLFSAYFVPKRRDPLGLACDQFCCTFRGNKSFPGWFSGSGSQDFTMNVECNNKANIKKCCDDVAKSKGWKTLMFVNRPCSGSGVCNVGQKTDVRVTGITFLQSTWRQSPRDSDLLGDMAIWEKIISIISCGGAVGAIDSLAGSETPGAANASDSLAWLNELRGRKFQDMNLWVKVQGKCCKNGTWKNYYEEHTFWYNCSKEIGELAEPKQVDDYIKRNLCNCLSRAKAAFDCSKKDNNPPVLSD